MKMDVELRQERYDEYKESSTSISSRHTLTLHNLNLTPPTTKLSCVDPWATKCNLPDKSGKIKPSEITLTKARANCLEMALRMTEQILLEYDQN